MTTSTAIRTPRRARPAPRTWPPRDRVALAAGLALPFLVALALVPARTALSHTDAALVLVVVAVAASPWPRWAAARPERSRRCRRRPGSTSS
ncbi:hypothetical protein ACH4OT_21955 [Streptomyces murinus]|uniref:hypothetical protein n=1 Tax=Streptomyces murinus TaxID=33900 RepID=UPI0037A6BF33